MLSLTLVFVRLLPEPLVACEITEKRANVMNREFPISVVTREDLLAANFSEDIVAKINDDDMQAIAWTMGNLHTEYGGYWEDLEQAVNKVLRLDAKDSTEEKEQYP